MSCIPLEHQNEHELKTMWPVTLCVHVCVFSTVFSVCVCVCVYCLCQYDPPDPSSGGRVSTATICCDVRLIDVATNINGYNTEQNMFSLGLQDTLAIYSKGYVTCSTQGTCTSFAKSSSS